VNQPYETIDLQIRDGVAWIVLNRPQAFNALDLQMAKELFEISNRLSSDRAVRCAVLTGSGQKAFCAGGDVAGFGADPPTLDILVREMTTYLHGAVSRFASMSAPLIAAVNGVAAGGGMVLAMMCDLRFAADTASFTTAFSKRGLIAEHGTAWLLPRLLGTSRALDLLWSARRIDAEEAYRMGFVDRLVPADQLIDETNRYLTELLATAAPRSIATIKRQVYAGWSQTFAESTIEMSRVLAASLDHPDLKEGVASFVERRPPNFAPVGPDDRHPSPSTQVHSDNDLIR